MNNKRRSAYEALQWQWLEQNGINFMSNKPKTRYFLGVDIPPVAKNPAAVALGKLGGQSKSAKKQAASRKNGAKHLPATKGKPQSD